MQNFEDVKVNVKIKLSALWVAVMLCYIYGDFFTLFVPGRIESLMDGKMGLGATTPLKLVVASIVMAIPAIMVFLSLTLKATINRWINISFGIIYTLIMILTILSSLDPWKAFYILFGVIEIALTLLIVWHAWMWPQRLYMAH